MTVKLNKLMIKLIIGSEYWRSVLMFNLSNLNDYEFELLCKDIMEVKLQKTLHTYPKGPDGGIDICDSEKLPNVIIQAKHYINSKYSDLFFALKKEIPKLQKLLPKRYYICSGLKLTKKQKNEIYSLFEDYMDDCSHIIDSIEIDDFLSEEENIDIVNKHYKLWLCSTSVLYLLNNKNVFIDCEELICDIEKDICLFVQTDSYFKAKRTLQENGIIIITGAPGVGKSTISKMLLMYFANENFSVRYTTDNDISSIKRVLSNDPNKKEIVLLDDFLGQHYLKIKDSQPNEIKSLISYIKKNPNKKIILNSRITIINEAIQTFIQFKFLMQENKSNEYLIELDKMSNLEKAKILYNHIYFNCLSKEYILQIKKNKNYFQIIKHKNYNPRIIEYVTKPINYKNILAEKYFEYILSKLDNPEDVWRDEFRNRISESDRVLMNTLYSLTNTGIDINILEKSFNKRIRDNGNKDTSLNTFKNVINRLGESLLRLTEERGKIKVFTINPSVNDYLNVEISPNVNEQMSIIQTATYVEQIFKVTKSEEAKQLAISLVLSGELLKIQCLYNSPFYYYLKMVIDNNIYDQSIAENIRLSLEHLNECITEVDDYSDMIKDTMLKKFIEFYHLQDIFLNSNKMYYILRSVEYNQFQDISERYINVFKLEYDYEDKYNSVLEIFKHFIVEKLSNVAKENSEVDLYQTISDKIDDFINERGEISEEALELSVQHKASDDMEDFIKNEIMLFNKDLQLEVELFDIGEIMKCIDFGDAMKSVIQENYADYDDDEQRFDWRSEYDEISNMFER